MNNLHKPWIIKGYQVFASEGPQGLKIERLSKSIGKNKSSFYHHFADLEVFIQMLLQYHLKQAEILAIKESNCKTIEEFIQLIIEYKTDLLFKPSATRTPYKPRV